LLSKFQESIGKRGRIQLRTSLNERNSAIECISKVGASFDTHKNKENDAIARA
jgi:hypothetical protein